MLESEWFEKKVPKIKRIIYIPRNIVRLLSLSKNDKIAVKIKVEGKEVVFPTRVQFTMTKTGPSYRFSTPKNFKNYFNFERILMKIIKLKYINSISRNGKVSLSELANYKNFSITTWAELNQIVIWYENEGKRPYEPVITIPEIEPSETLAKYSGLYFAEGNKQGYFRIYATTRELAKLVIKCYDEMIKNSNLKIVIKFNKAYRDRRTDDEIKETLLNYWNGCVKPYKINDIKITIRRPNILKYSNKYAEFGTLMMYDGRIIPRLLTNLLIQKIIEIGKTNKRIIEKLFEGGILGDGGITIRSGRRKRAFRYIEIGTNKKEVEVWESICKLLKLNYKKQVRKGNDIRIRINNFCDIVILLCNGFLKDFPKQRDKLIKGLKNRVETHIIQNAIISPNYSVPFVGEFAKRSSSYLVVNKGELILNKLINFDKQMITLSPKGLKFINNLKQLKII